MRLLDIVILTSGLGLSAWLVLKRRSRNGVLLLSLGVRWPISGFIAEVASARSVLFKTSLSRWSMAAT